MNQPATLRARRSGIVWNKIKTFFSKPHNVILLLMGIVVTITTIAPVVAIVEDTFKIHPGTIDAHLTGQVSGYTLVNYIDLFTSRLAKTNLWLPLLNTVYLAVGTCVVSIFFGGIFAFLITRTNLAWKQYLSSIFIFPYIMPQWTLAVVWQNLFNSNAVTGTSNGLLAATLGIQMPLWWCKGLFPCLVVLGLHYAPFACILIGGIFRNMDANLEEAATILDTPKWKTMCKITLPMIKPAILSTILLVFGSSMGSYPVPHYLGLTTLSTKYVSINFVDAKGAQTPDGVLELTVFQNRKVIFQPNCPVDLAQWFRQRDAQAEEKAAALKARAADKSYVEKSNKDEPFRYPIAKAVEDDFSAPEEPVITDQDFVLGIRPEAIGIAGSGSLNGEIYGAMPTGMESTIKVRVDDFLLTGVVFGSTLFTIGSQVHVDVTGDNVLLLDRKSGVCIAVGSLKV